MESVNKEKTESRLNCFINENSQYLQVAIESENKFIKNPTINSANNLVSSLTSLANDEQNITDIVDFWNYATESYNAFISLPCDNGFNELMNRSTTNFRFRNLFSILKKKLEKKEISQEEKIQIENNFGIIMSNKSSKSFSGDPSLETFSVEFEPIPMVQKTRSKIQNNTNQQIKNSIDDIGSAINKVEKIGNRNSSITCLLI